MVVWMVVVVIIIPGDGEMLVVVVVDLGLRRPLLLAPSRRFSRSKCRRK